MGRFEGARQRWPEVALDQETFDAYVERRLKPSNLNPGDPEPEAELSDDALAELYLACACSAGDATALALFDAHYLGAVPAALAHMRLPSATVDDVRQHVRSTLLVSEDGKCRLDDYAGRGRLRGLVQVVAVRHAISLLRKTKREVPGDALTELASPEHSPELHYMKESYRREFKRAFERAVRQLSSRDRNFLRLHLFGGLTVEQCGDIYGVHRATATRWLAKLRSGLLKETRRELGVQLEVSSEELDSLMELIQSRFEVSMERILQTIDATHSDPSA